MGWVLKLEVQQLLETEHCCSISHANKSVYMFSKLSDWAQKPHLVKQQVYNILTSQADDAQEKVWP